MPTHSDHAEIKRIGQALQQAEKTENVEAQIRLYKKLLRITPDLAVGHGQLAHLYFEQGMEQDAEPHVELALAQPHDPRVDKLVFPHMYESARFKADVPQARRWYEQARTLTRFKLLYQAMADNRGGTDEEIEVLLHQALEHFKHPGEQSQLLTLMGVLYYRQARFHDSIACYQLGLQMTPGHDTQLLNLAVTFEQVGRYNDALACYKQLLEKNPEHAASNSNIALNLLRLGEFAAGWARYEWRWPAAHEEHYQQFSIPRWHGEPLDGKTLLVWAEQGIGDHIMFASMLRELTEVAGELHFEIYARLDTLFQRSFPGVRFIRREQQGEQEVSGKKLFQQSWPRSDFQIPMGSLPAIFRPARESFLGRSPYLIADPDEIRMLREDYRRQFPGKRLIGISWRGGKTVHNEMQSRNIAFKYLAQLAACSDVQLIDLQYDSTLEDLTQAAQAGAPMYHDERIDARVDMDKQASQICALDAVVSVDNTTVHLAGALGAPAYALLPLNPNWRWGITGERAYWYDSVQLIRNREIASWEAAIASVIERLKADCIIG